LDRYCISVDRYGSPLAHRKSRLGGTACPFETTSPSPERLIGSAHRQGSTPSSELASSPSLGAISDPPAQIVSSVIAPAFAAFSSRSSIGIRRRRRPFVQCQRSPRETRIEQRTQAHPESEQARPTALRITGSRAGLPAGQRRNCCETNASPAGDQHLHPHPSLVEPQRPLASSSKVRQRMHNCVGRPTGQARHRGVRHRSIDPGQAPCRLRSVCGAP
jgi:hypothetical protein